MPSLRVGVVSPHVGVASLREVTEFLRVWMDFAAEKHTDLIYNLSN
jgi:hypothetical protein